ncbi:hypothetical protein C0993_010620 [Termitomyces sp. T159_Od127]|nr:hypothetical protein C0993_010620 [Termitomyces sp. T159_Od127]
MTKTKKKSKATTEIAQHTTTSETVKIRPRKRLQTSDTKAQSIRVQKVEEKENVAITLRPLPLANLDELFKIWDSDKRIPTVESRREWAAARNVAPQDVHRFFSRQKALAKKARRGLPKGTYTLSVGIPPVIKHEEEAPRSKPRRQAVRSNVKAEMLETPLSSDDFYVPTSETLIDLAQKEQKIVFEETKNSPLPPSSPLEPSSPTPSFNALSSILLFSPSLSHRLDFRKDHPDQGWCCQNRTPSSEASLTCILCTRGSIIPIHLMLQLTFSIQN